MHFGTSTARGSLRPGQGEVTLDRARRGRVEPAHPHRQVTPACAVFDARMRQDDLLASAELPRSLLRGHAQFRFDGEQLAEVRGEFTLRGVSQPLSLFATPVHVPHGAGRRRVCGGDFEASLLRSDFGATFGLPLIGNRVRLLVQVEGRRAKR